jgi:hypothetical protein
MSYLFHGQRKDENVLLITKQHPLILLKPTLIVVCLLLIPWLVNVFTSPGLTLAASLLISLLVAFLVGYRAWHHWENSVVMLTDERIVILHQRGMLHREFTECGLGTIQRVSHQVSGLLRTVFDYGDIVIVTGGVAGLLTLSNTPHPYEIQQEILRAGAGGDYYEEEEGVSEV